MLNIAVRIGARKQMRRGSSAPTGVWRNLPRDIEPTRPGRIPATTANNRASRRENCRTIAGNPSRTSIARAGCSTKWTGSARPMRCSGGLWRLCEGCPGAVVSSGDSVVIKTAEQIDAMRRSGRVLAGALRAMSEIVRPGISTADVDRVGEDYIRSHGGSPSFKGYQPWGADTPFPAAVCVSVNDVVVHGIPSDRIILQEGDLVGIDVGVCLDGCHTDAAVSVAVGPARVAKLMATTRRCWLRR